MPTLKDITELPLAESAEGVNLIVNDNGAAKQIAANVVGVKSWNDLEDKPFGEEEEIVLIERSVYSGFFNPEADFDVFEDLPNFDIPVGETVKVFWDGEFYSCEVKNYLELKYFGNGSGYINGVEGIPNTGEPFGFIITHPSNRGWVVMAYENLSTKSHEFGVTKVETKKLEKRYIPNDDSLYDLILEYRGQIYYGCTPETQYLEIYPKENVKKVIEKVNQGNSAKVLFRHRYFGFPSYCIEVPMQITAYENSMHCYALIHYYEEGTVNQLVTIYINDEGACGWISMDLFG